MLLSLDFKKAFDTVECQYIKYLLTKMNFGEQYIKIISEIYSQSYARLKSII